MKDSVRKVKINMSTTKKTRKQIAEDERENHVTRNRKERISAAL